jgi:1-hydroxycarotenoid 3,4-desaturase
MVTVTINCVKLLLHFQLACTKTPCIVGVMGADRPSILVVGAGVGGLACAIQLAAAGCRVRVLERAATAGGKARTVSLNGLEIDAGPTVLTMRWVFDELFSLAGTSFDREVDLERASILARHHWGDGTQLDLHADRHASVDAIATVFGPAEGRAYAAFCDDARRMYEVSEAPFLRGQRPTLAMMSRFGVAGLAAFARLDGHRTMWQSLERRFTSPKLRQLFGRYATYCGSSPFEAPATLNIVAHVEAEGVYRTRGGMRAIIGALEGVARRLGVDFSFGHHVDRIVVERGKTRGVASGDSRYDADAVVFNGDVSALGDGRLGAEAAKGATITPASSRSLSAVTWVVVARPLGVPLLRHNVFFSDHYREEFDALLGRRAMPSHPTVYVCAQDRGDDEADGGDERLLVIVNAPANGDEPSRWGEAERQQCTTAMMRTLELQGLTLEVRAMEQTTPTDLHRLFPGTGGALYGPRSSGPLSALSRASASTSVPGLYTAGGSVHPGPGVPMAMLSGRLAAAKILTDFGLTRVSNLPVTSGTTSMA